MRICFMVAAVFALASAASAMEPGRPTAILVSPIHEAQVVRGDDGMDHVEYELLVVSVFAGAGDAVERDCPRSRREGTHADRRGRPCRRDPDPLRADSRRPRFPHRRPSRSTST